MFCEVCASGELGPGEMCPSCGSTQHFVGTINHPEITHHSTEYKEARPIDLKSPGPGRNHLDSPDIGGNHLDSSEDGPLEIRTLKFFD